MTSISAAIVPFRIEAMCGRSGTGFDFPNYPPRGPAITRNEATTGLINGPGFGFRIRQCRMTCAGKRYRRLMPIGSELSDIPIPLFLVIDPSSFRLLVGSRNWSCPMSSGPPS
jgi:hypothetical protein